MIPLDFMALHFLQSHMERYQNIGHLLTTFYDSAYPGKTKYLSELAESIE